MEDSSESHSASILRATLALGRRVRSEGPERTITLSALSLLGTLVRSGPTSASDLAVAERLQPQSLTRLITRLEADGSIERRRSETDGRAIVIAVTTAGRRILTEDLGARQAWLERAMATALSAEERETLVRAADVMMKLAFSMNVPD